MRRLSVVGPVVVLAVSLLTVAITTLGPTPYRISTHPHILDIDNVLVEPVDRIVLISWWLVPILLGLAIWAVGRGHRPSTSRLAGVVGWSVGSLSVLVALSQIILDEDEIGLYPGISIRALGLGAGAAGVLLMTWYSRTRVAAVATWFLLIPLGLIAIAAAIQTPDGVTDADSFRFTSDELAAPATGELPLATFIPQYSTLMGLPIAPLLRALPQQSLWIILLWLLALQVATVLLAVRLPVRVGGWRMLLPAATVIVLPVIATGPSGLNGTTYFAGLPMRLLLPVAAVSVALAVTSADEGSRGRTPAIRYALLGSVVGLTVLNNLDFGAPAAVAVIVAVALQTRAHRLLRLGFLVLGAATPFVAYGLVGVATGRSVDWASGLTFPRVFGTEGYFNVAMQPYGLHVVFAALFGSATLIGALILATPRLPGQLVAASAGVPAPDHRAVVAAEHDVLRWSLVHRNPAGARPPSRPDRRLLPAAAARDAASSSSSAERRTFVGGLVRRPRPDRRQRLPRLPESGQAVRGSTSTRCRPDHPVRTPR